MSVGLPWGESSALDTNAMRRVLPGVLPTWLPGVLFTISNPGDFISKRSSGAPALCVWAALSSSHQHVAAACFQCSISHHGCIRRRSSWCKAKCLAVSMKLRNSCKEVIEQNMGRVPTSWYLLVPVQYPSSEARTTCRMSRKGTAALLHAL